MCRPRSSNRFSPRSPAVIPIIVLSARDKEANENRVSMAGAAAFFQKPYEDENLLAAIKSALGEPPPERGRRTTDK